MGAYTLKAPGWSATKQSKRCSPAKGQQSALSSLPAASQWPQSLWACLLPNRSSRKRAVVLVPGAISCLTPPHPPCNTNRGGEGERTAAARTTIATAAAAAVPTPTAVTATPVCAVPKWRHPLQRHSFRDSGTGLCHHRGSSRVPSRAAASCWAAAADSLWLTQA